MDFSADTSAKLSIRRIPPFEGDKKFTPSLFLVAGAAPQRKLNININTGSWFSGNTTNFGGRR